MPYILIDHTADTGIKVNSPTMESLFAEAARALADLMGARTAADDETFEIETQGMDRDDLLVRWLQEILFLIEVRGFRVQDVSIGHMSDTGIQGNVVGAYSQSPLESEIKAVTYHDLNIREVDNGFEVSIIFDI